MQEEIVEFLSLGFTKRSRYLEKYRFSRTDNLGLTLAVLVAPLAVPRLASAEKSGSVKDMLLWTKYRSRSA